MIAVIFHGCCCHPKKKVKTPSKGTPQSSKSRTVSQKEEQKSSAKMDKTEKEVSEVQFNIQMKKKVSRYDEFDDDEENPLAKLPVVSRPKKHVSKVKPSVSATPTPVTSTPTLNPKTKTTTVTATTAKLGPRLESERPLFPMTETAAGSSCYVNLH